MKRSMYSVLVAVTAATLGGGATPAAAQSASDMVDDFAAYVSEFTDLDVTGSDCVSEVRCQVDLGDDTYILTRNDGAWTRVRYMGSDEINQTMLGCAAAVSYITGAPPEVVGAEVGMLLANAGDGSRAESTLGEADLSLSKGGGAIECSAGAPEPAG